MERAEAIEGVQHSSRHPAIVQRTRRLRVRWAFVILLGKKRRALLTLAVVVSVAAMRSKTFKARRITAAWQMMGMRASKFKCPARGHVEQRRRRAMEERRERDQQKLLPYPSAEAGRSRTTCARSRCRTCSAIHYVRRRHCSSLLQASSMPRHWGASVSRSNKSMSCSTKSFIGNVSGVDR